MPSGMLTIPASHKKHAWIADAETGPYHVETSLSARNGGHTFNALCGAFGSYGYTAAHPYQKCATCQQLSTSGILDIGVADQGARIARDNTPITKGSLGGGHPASVPLPEVHDGLTIERIQVAVLNAELRARHVPNFSVSSAIDDGESRY